MRAKNKVEMRSEGVNLLKVNSRDRDLREGNLRGIDMRGIDVEGISTCVIIGSGNVATHLARALAPYVEIRQVYSRNLRHAKELAAVISEECEGINRVKEIDRSADLYLMAVTDDSIRPIVESVKGCERGIWVHTSGSVPMSVFGELRPSCGVFYPLQTFSKEKDVDMSSVPFYLEGSSTEVKRKLGRLAQKISRHVVFIDSERRRRLHISSVFACNFANYMWTLADKQLRMCGTDIHALDPLLKETFEKISVMPPIEAQTGPARRGDKHVIDSHVSMLSREEGKLYELISRQIYATYHPEGVENPKYSEGEVEKHSVLQQSEQENKEDMSKIDYELGKIRAFVFDVDGVLSPATVPMGADGMPMRMVNVKDGYAIQLAVKHGYKFAIITGGYSDALALRYKALGVKDVYMGSSMKLPILKKWIEENGLNPEEVVFVGDDIPDHDCMRYVGLSVAPADGDAEIKKVARYISPVNGGYGVGRDVIEEVMKAQGEWMSTEKAFGW